MSQELDVIIRHGFIDDRLDEAASVALRKWYDRAHSLMAEYKPNIDKPQDFEQGLLRESMQELRRQLELIQR
jgi:glucosyl-3-phosphoglycerate synthase